MVNNLKIIKTVSYLPDNRVDNNYFEERMETTDQWIYERTGIKERRFSDDESLEEMVKKACEKFNKDEVQGVDGVVVATMSNLDHAPTLSNMVQGFLGISNKSFCIDINAACSGYIYAMQIADSLIQSRICKKILVIGAEKMTDIVDLTDRRVAILFGDGVGISLVEASNVKRFKYPSTVTMYDTKSLEKRFGNTLQMNGQDVFKFAVRAISSEIENLKSKIEIEKVDMFVFHQANIRIIETVIKRTGIDPKKVITNIDRIGNTSAASIPILLSEHDISNKNIFMVGFGGGLSYGSFFYKNNEGVI